MVTVSLVGEEAVQEYNIIYIIRSYELYGMTVLLKLVKVKLNAIVVTVLSESKHRH